MRHVSWLETASRDLDEILGYIEDRNLLAALNLQQEIEHAVSQLPQHPYLYRLGRFSGTRELVVHPNYLVVYRLCRCDRDNRRSPFPAAVSVNSLRGCILPKGDSACRIRKGSHPEHPCRFRNSAIRAGNSFLQGVN